MPDSPELEELPLAFGRLISGICRYWRRILSGVSSYAIAISSPLRRELIIPMPFGNAISVSTEYFHEMGHAPMEQLAASIEKLDGAKHLLYMHSHYMPSLSIRIASENVVQLEAAYNSGGRYERIEEEMYDRHGYYVVKGNRVYRRLDVDGVLVHVRKLISSNNK